MSVAKRTRDPGARRAQLLSAALEVFADKGVSKTTVSDIVAAAGVAQGTFYLYFESKDDLVNAVAESLIDEAVGEIERAVSRPHETALEHFAAMRDAFIAVTDEPHEQELQRLLHQPENRAVHERMVRGVVPRLVPLVTHMVAQGIEEGVFAEQDPELSAWAVLGALGGLELRFGDPGRTATAIDELSAFVLRGLGYSGPRPPCTYRSPSGT